MSRRKMLFLNELKRTWGFLVGGILLVSVMTAVISGNLSTGFDLDFQYLINSGVNVLTERGGIN